MSTVCTNCNETASSFVDSCSLLNTDRIARNCSAEQESMSKWFLPLVLLYSCAQCSRSCMQCGNSVNCARCPLICWGCICNYRSLYFSNSERICGNDCTLCCATPYSRVQCMRTANGVRLDSTELCWRGYEFLQTASINADTLDWSISGTSSFPRQSRTSNQDSNDEDINHGAVWGGAVIGVVGLVILVVILKRYSPCLKTRTTSQGVQEEEVNITRTLSDGVSVPGQSANQGEVVVVVVVAPDGEVDVGLKDQK